MSDERLPVRTAEIVDRIDDAFFALDPEWRFTYLNDAAEEMLSRSREELLGQVFWDEFPETAETQFPDGFYHAIETGEPVAFEFYHRPLEAYLEAHAYPSDSGLTVSLRDVTDRRERERDLLRYQTIVEAINDGVLAIESNDRVGFANAAVADIFGADPADLVGAHLESLIDAADVDPEDAGEFGHALDQLRRGDAEQRRFEVGYTGPDGNDRVAEFQFVLLDDDRVAGVVRDVTDSRRFERVVTSLHSVTPQLLDADGHLEVASVAVHAAGQVLDLRVSGVWLIDEERNRLDPVAATAGAHEELGGLPHFPRGEGVVWDAFRGGDPALYDDVRDRPEHENAQLRSQIVVPIGEHGVLVAGETTPNAFDETDLELATILGANTEAALNRTERDRLLRQSQDTLERQSERLEIVESVLSGEVNDRLDAAVHHAEETGTEDLLETLDDTRRLVRDAVELAHGDESVRPRTRVQVGEVATEAADAVDGVTVTVGQDAHLRADRDRLRHLFETLFVNARRRAGRADAPTAGAAVIDPDADLEGAGVPTEAGGSEKRDDPSPAGQVEIRVTTDGDGDGDGTVRVVDDGPAIPESERSMAFELARVGEDEHAVGLGLGVAGEIAAAHGWETEAVADDGQNCFELRGVTTLDPVE